MLTNAIYGGILGKLTYGAAQKSKKEFQKISKNQKKLLTNASPGVILIKLSLEGGSEGCTLKIEQCKKKLKQNKHQKRVQVLRDT